MTKRSIKSAQLNKFWTTFYWHLVSTSTKTIFRAVISVSWKMNQAPNQEMLCQFIIQQINLKSQPSPWSLRSAKQSTWYSSRNQKLLFSSQHRLCIYFWSVSINLLTIAIKRVWIWSLLTAIITSFMLCGVFSIDLINSKFNGCILGYIHRCSDGSQLKIYKKVPSILTF